MAKQLSCACALVLTSLGACASPGSSSTTAPDASGAVSSGPAVHGAGGDLALRWSVSQGLWGSELFEVKRSGAAHYSFEPVAGGPDAKSFDVTVTQAQLDDIAEAAGRTGLCAEKSSRLGIPDEGRPTLELSLPGASCSVMLWDGEWEKRPGPKEVAAKVVALHRKP